MAPWRWIGCVDSIYWRIVCRIKRAAVAAKLLTGVAVDEKNVFRFEHLVENVLASHSLVGALEIWQIFHFLNVLILNADKNLIGVSMSV